MALTRTCNEDLINYLNQNFFDKQIYYEKLNEDPTCLNELIYTLYTLDTFLARFNRKFLYEEIIRLIETYSDYIDLNTLKNIFNYVVTEKRKTISYYNATIQSNEALNYMIKVIFLNDPEYIYNIIDSYSDYLYIDLFIQNNLYLEPYLADVFEKYLKRYTSEKLNPNFPDILKKEYYILAQILMRKENKKEEDKEMIIRSLIRSYDYLDSKLLLPRLFQQYYLNESMTTEPLEINIKNLEDFIMEFASKIEKLRKNES